MFLSINKIWIYVCITVKAVKLKTFHYNPLYVRGGAGGPRNFF